MLGNAKDAKYVFVEEAIHFPVNATVEILKGPMQEVSAKDLSVAIPVWALRETVVDVPPGRLMHAAKGMANICSTAPLQSEVE